MPMSTEELLAIRDRHEDWISSQEGCTGVGLGGRSGNPAIVVYSDRMRQETKRAIEARLAGVPVEFEETGAPRAF